MKIKTVFFKKIKVNVYFLVLGDNAFSFKLTYIIIILFLMLFK